MNAALIGVVVGAAGAVIGGVITFLSTRWQIRAQLETDYDRTLRGSRTAAYAKLGAES